MAAQLFRPVLRQLGHRRLGGVPHPGGVLVQIGSGAGQPSQRVAEDCRWLAGHHTTELYAAVVDAAVGGGGGGRRTEVHGAGHTPSGGIACRDLGRRRRSSGAANWCRPRPSQSPASNCPADSGSTRLHTRIVNGQRGWQDQRAAVALLPRLWMTAAISRSTPLVRWKWGRADQSSYNRLKISGWMG